LEFFSRSIIALRLAWYSSSAMTSPDVRSSSWRNDGSVALAGWLWQDCYVHVYVARWAIADVSISRPGEPNSSTVDDALGNLDEEAPPTAALARAAAFMAMLGWAASFAVTLRAAEGGSNTAVSAANLAGALTRRTAL
jgi:hypothetical protein